MLQSTAARITLLCGLCLLSATAFARTGATAPSNAGSVPNYAQQSAEGVRTLQQWYVRSTGLYAAPSGWWNAANAITVLANYSRASGSRAIPANPGQHIQAREQQPGHHQLSQLLRR